MANNLRLAVRRLARSPGFTAAAAITLALGIGANSAIFSVTNAAVLRWRTAFVEPERLAMVWKREGQYGNWQTTPADFRDWRERNTVFEELSGFDYRSLTLQTDGDPERVLSAPIVPGLFAMLGVHPRLGRAFANDDATWGRHRVALLSDGLWRGAFGADPAIVGRALILDGERYDVVGVMPPGAWFATSRVQLWVPMAYPTAEEASARNSGWHFALGRLAPGVSREQAGVEMAALAARIAAQHPGNADWSAAVTALEETVLGDIQPTLYALTGAVGLVLLLACVNVAALTLARTERHGHEMSVRAALGASRRQLATLVFTEGLVLSALGGLLGFGLAHVTVGRLVALAPAEIPRLHETGVAVDLRVLFFTFGLSLVTALAFALGPALRSSRPRPATALAQSRRGATDGRQGRRYRALLVIAEVALSALLLIGAGLLIRTLGHLHTVDLGVRDDGLLTVPVQPPLAVADQQVSTDAFFEQLIARTEALPAVRAAGLSSGLPLHQSGPGFYLGIAGRPDPATLGEVPIILLIQESSRSLQAAGARLIRGRLFDDRDDDRAPKVAVINETLAARFFPDQDPIGAVIRLGAPKGLWLADELPSGERFPRHRIVGVIRDIRYEAFGDHSKWAVYVPYRQRHAETMAWLPRNLIVHTNGEPFAALPGIRAVLRDLDPAQPHLRARSRDDLEAEAFRNTRFAVQLFTLFAVLALALAAIGIYGVIAYSVACRRREIGVRVALGAERRHVVGLVSHQVLSSVVLGLGLGAVAALGLTRFLEGLLDGVTYSDPLTFTAVGLILLAVAALAAYLPARRATAIAPTEALRAE